MIRIDRAARLAARLLLVAGLLALGYVGYVVVDARRYQAIEERHIERAPLDDVAAAESEIVDGHAIGTIHIPRLGLATVVAQGDSTLTLRRAVGHLADSALPGEMGNVVLAGHRDTVFRALKDILPGDAITIETVHGAFSYQVESTAVVSPSDVAVLQAHGGRTLTLVTCFPFFYVGPSPDRFIVRARQVESVRGGGRPRSDDPVQ
jgi:sortase A